jgi:hypothetical protein
LLAWSSPSPRRGRQFTPEEIAHYKRSFIELDVDNSGTVDTDELHALFKALGTRLSRRQVVRARPFRRSAARREERRGRTWRRRRSADSRGWRSRDTASPLDAI